MIAAPALDADMTALFATAVLCLLLASLAHVESPTYRVVVVIKLLVSLEFVRTVCFGLGRCFGFLFGLQISGRSSPVSTLIN